MSSAVGLEGEIPRVMAAEVGREGEVGGPEVGSVEDDDFVVVK